jgi:CubicO group peptidase (beta-lactamase class C family)
LDIPNYYTSGYWAADGVVSTASDLCAFMRALLADRELWGIMSASVDGDPRGRSDERYGFGIKRISEGEHGVRFGHGGNGGASLYYWPEQDIVFAGTTNTNLTSFGTFVRQLMSEPGLAVSSLEAHLH